MRFPAAAAAALLLCGCSTPFSTMGPETGPPEDPQSLGASIHGWPWLDHGWHGDAERTDVLWPLVSVRSSRSGDPPKPDSFLPLFVHSSSPAGVRWGLRPLFDVESRDTEKGPVSDTDLLFPIFKSRTAPEDERLEVRPIWFQGRHGERSWLTVFPVWFSQSDAESSSTLVLPTFYRAEEKGEVRDLHIWPFWGMHAEGTFRRDWTLFPFFSIARDPGRDLLEWDAPFPLVHYGTSKDSSSLRILPLYLRETSPVMDATIVFPFWWSIEEKKSRFRMAFPVWADWKDGTKERWTSWLGPVWIDATHGKTDSTDVLWPLFRTEADPKGWSARLFPVLWLDRHGETKAYTHVWPLFGDSMSGGRREVSTLYPFFQYGWDEDSWSFEAPFPFVGAASKPNGWDARAWPLFAVENRGESSKGEVLIIARWNSSEKRSEFRVLWKIFERERTAERTKTALNPLFRIETNARGDTHWSVLFGLLAATTEEDATRWRILWFL